MFNCRLGKFPMVYLGVPIHIKKLRKDDLYVVNENEQKD
jgi:hypothetical protein